MNPKTQIVASGLDKDTVENKLGGQDTLQWPIPELIENQHYYMENGFMVFTELYHQSRGRCCGNACRHCPFEHVNVRSR